MEYNENQSQNFQIESIQNLIGNEVIRSGINEKIKQLSLNENASEEEIIQKIKEGGIIDEVMSNLKKIKPSSQNAYYSHPPQSQNKISLYLKLNNGYNFIDYDDHNLINDNEDDSLSYFEFDIHFFGQRFRTNKIPVSCEFKIGQTFLMDFNPLKNDIELTNSLLKKISTPLHIAILLHENKTIKLVSSKSIEWRWVLCYGSWKIEADFKSQSSLNNVNIGSIEMVLSIVPQMDKTLLLSETSITEQINKERKNEIERTQDYLNYTTNWWENYKTINPSFSSRIVKLFLQTEDREYYAYKPACCLIESISVGRAINTPYEAARFVSLIPFERREDSRGEKIEIWHSMHTFLSLKKGDVEDHVTLLCNLLLGFGLDAYIASGIAVNGPHLWVITRNKIQGKNYEVTFWESLTGQRILGDDPKVSRFYKKIHCVFNDSSFYANMQKDDNVFNSKFNFEDENYWKSIEKDKIESLPKYSITPLLDVINIDQYKVENDIEKMIKRKVSKFRNELELKTEWDNKLAFLIAPALVNYEMERISNLTYGNEEFKASVKNCVPEGFSFKAFPFQISELDSEKIFGMIMVNEIGKDILNTRGDQVTFAIRCKLYPYPQNIYSLWVMIATRYRVIK